MNQQPTQPGLYIGIDWADQKHDIHVIDRQGKGFHRQLEHSAENIDGWVGDMLKLAGGQPIAIMLEQSRGALIYALMFREDVLLYPVNPKQLARYRESYPRGNRTSPCARRWRHHVVLYRGQFARRETSAISGGCEAAVQLDRLVTEDSGHLCRRFGHAKWSTSTPPL